MVDSILASAKTASHTHIAKARTASATKDGMSQMIVVCTPENALKTVIRASVQVSLIAMTVLEIPGGMIWVYVHVLRTMVME